MRVIARLAPLVVVTAAAFGAGCTHVTSEVPGVLDLRSDGGDAPVRSEALAAEASRDGISGFFSGAGTTGATDVTIEDRNSLLAVGPLVLMSVLNSSSTEEWRAALGKDGALRNLSIGEQVSGMAFASTLVKEICLCPAVGGWVSPSIDFQASGTRISTGAAGVAPGAERDESIPPALPADGSAGLGTAPAKEGDVNF